jgi:hypothetical protein
VAEGLHARQEALHAEARSLAAKARSEVDAVLARA